MELDPTLQISATRHLCKFLVLVLGEFALFPHVPRESDPDRIDRHEKSKHLSPKRLGGRAVFVSKELVQARLVYPAVRILELIAVGSHSLRMAICISVMPPSAAFALVHRSSVQSDPLTPQPSGAYLMLAIGYGAASNGKRNAPTYCGKLSRCTRTAASMSVAIRASGVCAVGATIQI